MDSFRSIIEIFGTRKALATKMGITEGNASLWWQRDIIPAEYFPDVVAACEGMGYPVTLEMLHQLLRLKRDEKKAGQRVKA